MSSIPLPVLSIRPPENPLTQYARALSVKSMIEGGKQQQLQTTAMQQENQQRQQAIADQQATTKAMSEWNGKKYEDLFPLIIKHGGSSNAVMGLQKSILDQQEKKSVMAKNDAETGAKTLETQQNKDDMLLGHLQAATSVGDDQLINQVKTEKNAALLGGYLDQPHADMLDQLLATGDPAKIRSSLQIIEKGLVGGKQQYEQAYKERDLAAKEWKEFSGLGVLVNSRTGEVKDVSGGKMTPPMMESKYVALQQDKALGRKLSDEDAAFLKGYERMKTLVPAFTFNLQAGSTLGQQPLTPPQQATATAILEGRMTPPSSFALRTPYWQNIMGNVFAQDPQFSEQRAELRKDYTVGRHANEINAINTAMGHVGALSDAVDALKNGNLQVLNKIANAYNVQTGSDPVTTFNTIVHRVGPEITKAYVGAGGGEAERGTTESDFSAKLSPEQLKSNIGITAKLLRSKIASLENQWNQNKSDTMPAFQDRFIMPAAKQALDKLAPGAGGGGGTKPARWDGKQWVDATTGKPIQ